ncbi:hypothetical protein HDU67_007785 [Dinochytrium kinnereticum]|nr:hypothetical protein HDU67_007785 [Dinochytrium kinnereticum]
MELATKPATTATVGGQTTAGSTFPSTAGATLNTNFPSIISTEATTPRQTLSDLELEGLKAVQVLLGHWDQEYFSSAVEETGFVPASPAKLSSSPTEEKQRDSSGSRVSVLQTDQLGRVSVAAKSTRASVVAVEMAAGNPTAGPKEEPSEVNIDGMKLPEGLGDSYDSRMEDEFQDEAFENDDEMSQENRLNSSEGLPEKFAIPEKVNKLKDTLRVRYPNAKMADGGMGHWKYHTCIKGSDPEKGKVQFFTVWSTPTSRMPVPRATAGVWFTYSRKDSATPADERKIKARSILEMQSGMSASPESTRESTTKRASVSKPSTTTSTGYWGGGEGNPAPSVPATAGEAGHDSRPDTSWKNEVRNQIQDMQPPPEDQDTASETGGQESMKESRGDDFAEEGFQTSMNGTRAKVIHPLKPIAQLTYRFQHQHLSHTVSVPSDVYLLPMTLPPVVPRSLNPIAPTSNCVMLGAPSQRIPEIVASNLQISKAVESGLLLADRAAKAEQDFDREWEQDIVMERVVSSSPAPFPTTTATILGQPTSFASAASVYGGAGVRSPAASVVVPAGGAEGLQDVSSAEEEAADLKDSTTQQTLALGESENHTPETEAPANGSTEIVSSKAYADALQDDSEEPISELESMSGGQPGKKVSMIPAGRPGSGVTHRPASSSSNSSNPIHNHRESFFGQRVSVYNREPPPSSRPGTGHFGIGRKGLNGSAGDQRSRLNGNGVPEDVIQELERTTAHPVLTASMVIRRSNILHASQIGRIPIEDEKKLEAIREKKLEMEKERLIRLEVKAQSRALQRGIALRMKKEAEASEAAAAVAAAAVNNVQQPQQSSPASSQDAVRPRSGSMTTAGASRQGASQTTTGSPQRHSPISSASAKRFSTSTGPATLPAVEAVVTAPSTAPMPIQRQPSIVADIEDPKSAAKPTVAFTEQPLSAGGGITADWFNAASEGAADRARAKSHIDLTASPSNSNINAASQNAAASTTSGSPGSAGAGGGTGGLTPSSATSSIRRRSFASAGKRSSGIAESDGEGGDGGEEEEIGSAGYRRKSAAATTSARSSIIGSAPKTPLPKSPDGSEAKAQEEPVLGRLSMTASPSRRVSTAEKKEHDLENQRASTVSPQTENNERPSSTTDKSPHEIPLPDSRATTTDHKEPHEIPLPASRATTAGDPYQSAGEEPLNVEEAVPAVEEETAAVVEEEAVLGGSDVGAVDITETTQPPPPAPEEFIEAEKEIEEEPMKVPEVVDEAIEQSHVESTEEETPPEYVEEEELP